MMATALKIIIGALLAVIAAEAAKRMPAVGALIIALPLTSMLGMVFLYYDTRDVARVAEFARAIPPAVLPSIAFFYAFVFLVEYGLGFVMAMALATAAMLGGYGIFLLMMRQG